MKMKFLFNLIGSIFILFILLSIKSCDFVTNSNNSITIIVDSVFINQYEKGELYAPLYIYYHISLLNESCDTLNINLPLCQFDKKNHAQNIIYGIYRNDTIPFFSGTNITVIPDKKASFTIRYGSGNEIMVLYEKIYNREFSTIQGFMHDFVINSKLHFEIMSQKYTMSSSNTKIIYRDTEDKDEHTWPL